MISSLPRLSVKVVVPLEKCGLQAHLWKGVLDTGTEVCLRHEKDERMIKNMYPELSQYKLASILRDEPNIVKIRGLAVVNYNYRDYQCLVMDHYTQDLEQWLCLGTFFYSDIHVRHLENTVTSLRILIECAIGVSSLHRKGFVHLDIRAANFLVNSKHNTIHLTDFGHTVPIGYVSQNYCGGTGAPEIFNWKLRPITPKADVYSFGMLICEVLFGGDSDFQIHWSRQSDHEVFDPFMTMIKTHKVKMTPTLESLHKLCRQCWYIDSSKRPAIDQVRQELQTILRAHMEPPKNFWEK